jgi:large subunit ribosomal protein L9
VLHPRHLTATANSSDSARALQVGENDQIFGSVQASEITQYIEQQTGRKLDARNMTLPEMKTLGTYEASIKLHPDVTGFFKVQVIRQPN